MGKPNFDLHQTLLDRRSPSTTVHRIQSSIVCGQTSLTMAGGALHATDNIEHTEAPVTLKAYLLCAFASFGGIFFGYDSGYINGVNGSEEFIRLIEGPTADALKSSNQSLIVSILSAGIFFGAIIAGDVADRVGRKWTVIGGCAIYIIGVIIQMLTGVGGSALGVIVGGRVIAGIGVGFESAIVILYMSEICPKKVRGALVAGYQFCITIGLLVAACVVYACENKSGPESYRIPIGIQFAWAIILAGGLFFLPDSPRYYVKKGRLEDASRSLQRLRGQPAESEYIQNELAEIIANEEYERSVIPSAGFFDSWANCFKGSLFKQSSNIRRTILGTSLQMMQQWTGVNFIFYYSTPFLQSTGAISNTFLISLIFTLVNVCSTPLSFWAVEKLGRRPLLVWGALGMLICQFLVAIIGVTVGFNHTSPDANGDPIADNISAVNAQIAFIAIFIFFFATTWGPGAWILIGEIFPLPIRSRGVGPAAFVYSYLLVPETKGLSLEQVDRMMEESSPRTSAKWVPHETFASAMGVGGHADDKPVVEHDVEKRTY